MFSQMMPSKQRDDKEILVYLKKNSLQKEIYI